MLAVACAPVKSVVAAGMQRRAQQRRGRRRPAATLPATLAALTAACRHMPRVRATTDEVNRRRRMLKVCPTLLILIIGDDIYGAPYGCYLSRA